MPSKPNILFLQVDQLSASALRAYGNGSTKTPTIDGLARRGSLFENAYTTFPVCAPSRCSMMSGCLASAIEAYDNAAEFRASIPTVAHYLRHAGYQTSLCGKMHFIGPDLLHGFEERLTPEIYSSDFATMPDWSTPEPEDFASDAREALEEAGPAPRTVQIDYDEDVAYHAEQKLYDLARSDDPRPFFLLVSFTHPHDPYICRQEFWDRFNDDDIELPHVGRISKAGRDEHSARIYQHYNLDDPRITDDLVRSARHGYYGSLAYVDSLLGKVLQALEDAGLSEDTIVLLTSDHGDMLGERGMWFKKTLFENAVRVPLILVIPGQESRRIEANVSLVDLLPTLVELSSGDASFEAHAPIDGHSLLPLLRGDVDGWGDMVFAEITCESVPEPVVMVRRGPHKFIYSERAGALLYDLESDPWEQDNLADSAAHADLIDTFRGLVQEKWGDLSTLKRKVISSQQTRRFVAAALETGVFRSWDENDASGGGERYLRHGKSYNVWNYHGVKEMRANHRSIAGSDGRRTDP